MSDGDRVCARALSWPRSWRFQRWCGMRAERWQRYEHLPSHSTQSPLRTVPCNARAVSCPDTECGIPQQVIAVAGRAKGVFGEGERERLGLLAARVQTGLFQLRSGQLCPDSERRSLSRVCATSQSDV
eukprot:1630409-Rhodomonas_salina.3